jgi:hypothetical protein
MKSYKIEEIESQASPLYKVIVEENDGSILTWHLAINDKKQIDAVVRAAYEEFKNPPPPKVPSYKEKRRAEYPPIEDYLDGIVKNDQAQIQKYIDDCLAVKAKYPKG